MPIISLVHIIYEGWELFKSGTKIINEYIGVQLMTMLSSYQISVQSYNLFRILI